jgi:predicted  nucleic acid-binding Zn-ribbon protein
MSEPRSDASVDPTDEATDDAAALHAEIDRLRELVGPSEQSYVDLRHDLLAARDAAKGAEATAGVLRGQVAELEVAVARARQDQEHFQRAVFGGVRSARSRVARAVRARLF